MSKDPRVYLVHILERIDRILRYTQQGRDSFFRDTMIQDAVVRGLEVMGEAAKRIPNDFRDQHKEIPWRSLSALSDVLIHQYEGVSVEEDWRVVESELPQLCDATRNLVPNPEQIERDITGSFELR